ncbi:MAG: ABC transporter ATP-binding protein [Eubacteriales bacterium]|nr:ABC transporter ATP-binding protein [Eubacteriales bacterium]
MSTANMEYKNHTERAPLALHLENVTMQFGGVVSVNNLTLDVPQGKIIALIGPNGAGKTTAFNCITGVYQPTNGLIEFMGEPMVRTYPRGKDAKIYKGENRDKYSGEHVLTPTPDQITQLGIARTFQNIRLWKSMTVFDNVLTAKHMRAKQNVFSAIFRMNMHEEKRMREETMDLLREQGLEKVKDELATSLPYGLQRRLEIARALATNPKLLLLDEPAAGMNPQETLELADFVQEIREKYKLTVFLIEHHMDLVMNISDYIYVIDFGSEIAQGVPEEVQNNHRVIEAYLGIPDEDDGKSEAAAD